MTTLINFQRLFFIDNHRYSQHNLFNMLLDKSSPIRKSIIDYANMSDEEWSSIEELISIDGEIFKSEPDQEKCALKMSPGNIDYNVFYQDDSSYQEPIKAGLLLECFREIFVASDPAYSFLFNHVLVKYHTYAGVDNDNFKKIIKHEIQEYDMSHLVTETQLNNFLDVFEKKWAKHLQDLYTTAIEDGATPIDIIILTGYGDTAQKVLSETLKSGFSAQGNNVQIINESSDLGQDPLSMMIGFSRSQIVSRVKKQAGDEILYRALAIISKRITPFIDDTRMDILRKKTMLCENIISLNTFAHDARLVADGKTVIFDVSDTGLINRKLMQLARHQVKHCLEGIKFLIHPPGALIKDDQGNLFSVNGSDAFYMTQYAVQSIKEGPLTSFKSDVNLLGERLSVLTFTGLGCAKEASAFLKILTSNDDYPEEFLQQRDIVLLAETDHQSAVQDLCALLHLDGHLVTEKIQMYQESEFTACSIICNAQKVIHIWSPVSQALMYALSQYSDHFIIKPDALSVADAISWQARGVVVYYDATNPLEKGNAQLLTTHGAEIIYDRTPLKLYCNILKQSERKMLDINYEVEQYPSVINTATHIFSKRESPELKQKQVSLSSEANNNTQDIYTRGINCAANRIINAQLGSLKKDTDRIISLAPGVSREQIESFFINVFNLTKTISAEAIDSIGTEDEDAAILTFTHLLQEAEQNLLITEDAVSILPGHIQDKPIVIWTGFAAMDAAIRDPEGVCNFDVPILNMLFILWEEVFCHPASSMHSELLSKIPAEYPVQLLQAHPLIKQLQLNIQDDFVNNKDMTIEEITGKYFGSELKKDDNLLAEKMGTLVSRVFVNEFHHHTCAPIVYFSINKINEFDTPALAINSISWDYELPLLRKLYSDSDIRFKSVTDHGVIIEIPFNQLFLVRNRFFKENILQDRRFYTCGMPGLPEWLIYSSQPPRPTIAVYSIQNIIQKWRFFTQKQILSKTELIQDEGAPIQDPKQLNH